MQAALRLMKRNRQTFAQLRAWGKTLFPPRVRRILGLLILAGVLIFLGATLIESWAQVRPYLDRMNPSRVLAGQLCTLIAFAIGGLAWFYIQLAFGFDVTWQQGLVIHLASNATKYLPGYVWQYASKAYLSKEKDTSTQRLSLAILSEVVLLFSSGIVAACVTGGLAGDYWSFPWAVPRWVWPVAGTVTALLTVGWVAFMNRLADAKGRSVRVRWLLAVWLVDATGWILYGVACWLFVDAFSSIPAADFAQCLVALVASAIVSLLVIFVPSGLGVREATLAALLVGMIPFSLGVVVGIAVRLSVIISELLGVVAVLGLNRHWPERLKYAYSFWGIRQNTPK